MTITTRKRALGGLALLGASALVLAGCAAAPEEAPEETAALDFTPCIVSGTGGWDDASFNQLALQGFEEATAELGVEGVAVESQSESDYQPNIESVIAEGCDLVVTVGFDLAPATVTAALANPDVSFALVDDAADTDFDGAKDAENIKPILFNTAEAAFLAGYASAARTTTGILGTYGGMNFPTVAIFMDGYAQGVDYYNEENGTNVELRGWDRAAQDGTFIGGFAPGVESLNAAQNLLDLGADVILPVGGGIYISAAEAIRDSGDDSVVLLGVDADFTVTDPSVADIVYTSILKQISVAVYDVILEASGGAPSFDPYIGTLENGGVGIAPFYDFADPEVEAAIEELAAAIIAGEIEVESYLN
ncbi:MAG: hypothetical protein RL499_984 [Actinomycetota bacterium]